MERTETPALWRKLPETEIPVPVATAPAPYSAAAQCGRAAAQRRPDAGQPSAFADAGGVAVAKSGTRCGADEETGGNDRTRTLRSRSQPTRRNGRNIHHQPRGRSAKLASMPGYDQRDRESSLWSAQEDRERLAMAGWRNGDALGGRSISPDRKELSKNHGLSRSLDLGRNPRPTTPRHFFSEGKSGVR
jgi:hypothetical protein